MHIIQYTRRVSYRVGIVIMRSVTIISFKFYVRNKNSSSVIFNMAVT